MSLEVPITKLTEKQASCVREVARQLIHPVSGLRLPEEVNPRSFVEWREFLSTHSGWVNVGIEVKVQEVFSQLQWGEVITNTNPDLTLYKRAFFSQVILNKLRPTGPNGEKEEYSQRIVMNFESFDRLAKLVYNEIPPHTRQQYINEYSTWKKDVSPRVFWVNFVISERVANLFARIGLGEVMTKEGRSSFFDFIPDKHESKDMVCMSKKDGSYYRLLMNENTMRKIVEAAFCYTIKNKSPHCDYQCSNLFELFGGETDDLMAIFGQMKI